MWNELKLQDIREDTCIQCPPLHELAAFFYAEKRGDGSATPAFEIKIGRSDQDSHLVPCIYEVAHELAARESAGFWLAHLEVKHRRKYADAASGNEAVGGQI